MMLLKTSAIAAAVLLGLGSPVHANPTAPRVVSGNATFSSSGTVLTVTNSPNSIINWQSFSIAAGETTRFVQPGPASAVLNRVIGQDPSLVLGNLFSNGRVFLVNRNGILFGATSRVNVSALAASTQGLGNASFLSGNYHFGNNAAAGPIDVNGAIRAKNTVALIGGIVSTPGVINARRIVIREPGSDGGAIPMVSSGDSSGGNQVPIVSTITPNGATLTVAGSLARGSGRITLSGVTVTANPIPAVAPASAAAPVAPLVTAQGSTAPQVVAAPAAMTLILEKRESSF